MSTRSLSLAPPANLAEVLERLSLMGDQSRQRRQDLMSAVRKVAKLLDCMPADLPADPEALRKSINPFTPASAGTSVARWRNVRALLTAALELSGATVVRRRRLVVLTPTWESLLKGAPDRFDRTRLSRFATFASARGVAPEQVNDRTVEDFTEYLQRSSLLERKTQIVIVRNLCLAWNRCVDSVLAWPNVRLTRPDRRRCYALPASAYPPSFGADVEAYLAHLAGGDLFNETGRSPASPSTLREVRKQLFQMAAALVLSGRAPDSICTLADVVEPEATKIALNFFWLRKGKRKTAQIHNFALTAIKIARWWVKAPPESIAALQAIRRQVDPNERGMTARNRARLRQFDDPENLRRLINLPDAILRASPRSTSPNFDQALRVQSALAIAILMTAPMRIRNLSSLCLGRHLVRTRVGGARHIVIPPEEVKNRTPLSFEVSGGVGAVLDVYLERYRPRLAGDPMGFLFPSRSGGAKTPAQLADQIKRTIRQETGIDLNAHAFRHLAALLFLRAHPGEYETVRLLLGHKDLSTTVGAYCGLEQADALRRYDALIERHRKA